MSEVFVGCGSNIEPEQNLRWALGELERHFGKLLCSSVYRSPAFGFAGPDFLNMVVAFEADAGADTIEAVLSQLENLRGRDERDRSGSRTLDLDLLLYGARVDAERRLPRIDILHYPFVLAPLAEIRPQCIHPVTGTRIGAEWEAAAGVAQTLTVLDALDAA
jgi:2-amino-4-hydroxy-6-hydroxymethyldihydropteridine diphosphokinase